MLDVVDQRMSAYNRLVVHDIAVFRDLMVNCNLHSTFFEHGFEDAAQVLLALAEGLVGVREDLNSVRVRLEEFIQVVTVVGAHPLVHDVQRGPIFHRVLSGRAGGAGSLATGVERAEGQRDGQEKE